jgi:hypothetical protein
MTTTPRHKPTYEVKPNGDRFYQAKNDAVFWTLYASCGETVVSIVDRTQRMIFVLVVPNNLAALTTVSGRGWKCALDLYMDPINQIPYPPR